MFQVYVSGFSTILESTLEFYATFRPHTQVLRSRIVRIGQNMRKLVFNHFFVDPFMEMYTHTVDGVKNAPHHPLTGLGF